MPKDPGMLMLALANSVVLLGSMVRELMRVEVPSCVANSMNMLPTHGGNTSSKTMVAQIPKSTRRRQHQQQHHHHKQQQRGVVIEVVVAAAAAVGVGVGVAVQVSATIFSIITHHRSQRHQNSSSSRAKRSCWYKVAL